MRTSQDRLTTEVVDRHAESLRWPSRQAHLPNATTPRIPGAESASRSNECETLIYRNVSILSISVNAAYPKNSPAVAQFLRMVGVSKTLHLVVYSRQLVELPGRRQPAI